MNLIKKIRRKVFGTAVATGWTREDWLAFSAKQAGYRAARAAAAALPKDRLRSRTMSLTSKTVTQEDLSSTWARYWLRELGEPFRFHRQPWEFAYVLQSLRDARCIGSGVRALVLGEQRNPILSYLAARGVHNTVLLHPGQIDAASTPMHELMRKMSHRHELIAGDRYDVGVTGRIGSVADIPTEEADFDVVWTIDHLNRLNNAAAARSEILSAMRCLRPGGVGVFVFDLDLSSEGLSSTAPRLRREDLRMIASQMIAEGHYVSPLNFKAGEGPLDCFIDTPPYPGHSSQDLRDVWGDDALHLKLLLGGAVCTSFGMMITRRPA